MNKFFLVPLFAAMFLAGCYKVSNQSDSIISMQIRDRNGFSETISNKDRLKVYQAVDFLCAQPYEKVLRVYGKDGEGKSRSKLTSYHENGGPWQYLEAVDGRANGKYLEWHKNGKIKVEGKVIEGLADLSPSAQNSWLFDGISTVWDEMGNVEAVFQYHRGQLIDEATFYYPSGKIARTVTYRKGRVDGVLQEFDEEGRVLKKIAFKEGVKHGQAISNWKNGLLQYQEKYEEGNLISGSYLDFSREPISKVEDGEGVRAEFEGERLYSLTQYQKGRPEGQVQLFGPDGEIRITYQLQGGMKTGEEWEYYLNGGGEKHPKLLVNWFEDQIQGLVKTWYENGMIESQREMSANKKHGLSFAYYRCGDLMMVEEYENNKLIKGSYFKKGDENPVSEVNAGDGVATLYNADGYFFKKVTYEKGKPLVD